MEDLSVILLSEELHLVKLLIKEVGLELAVRVGIDIGTKFKTNIGTPQGNCISPILFTCHLAKALRDERDRLNELDDHTYPIRKIRPPTIPKEVEDHTYSISRDIPTVIELQYADDICWISAGSERTVFMEWTTTEKTSQHN